MDRSELLDDRIRPIVDTVHSVEPTSENARRLWQDYQNAFLCDKDLFARICSPESGIDGLTETLSAADILATMQLPDTITLEVDGSGSDNLGGFVIVHYATRDAESIRAFRSYFLEDVFRLETLKFRSSSDRARFLECIDNGQIMYFGEFVSRRGRATSAALVVAAYHEVCVRRLGATSCAFVGKCLDSVRVGSCRNLHGNRPVKALAESLGLEKFAQGDQVRRLHVDGNTPHFKCAFPERTAESTAGVDAILTFALYFGQTRSATERIIRQLTAL